MIAKLERQGREIFQWGEEFVDITTLENRVYEAALRWGREIMRRCLKETDRILSRQRNKAVYRDKVYRPTTLKTVMGEVGYRRHVYLLSGEAEQTVYLLDKSMGLDTVGLRLTADGCVRWGTYPLNFFSLNNTFFRLI